MEVLDYIAFIKKKLEDLSARIRNAYLPKYSKKSRENILFHSSSSKSRTISRLLEDGIQGPKNANLALDFMETSGKTLISQQFIKVRDYVSLIWNTIISKQPTLAKTIHSSAGLYFAFIEY